MGQPYDTEVPTEFGLGLHHVHRGLPNPFNACFNAGWRVGFTGVSDEHSGTYGQPNKGRGGLWVRADRLEIHLGVEPDFRPARKAHPGILVGDLDALAERLCAHGVEVTWDDNFPGYRRFYAFDNAGNRLEFLMSLGNRGSIS